MISHVAASSTLLPFESYVLSQSLHHFSQKTFFTLLAVFLTGVDRWEGHSDDADGFVSVCVSRGRIKVEWTMDARRYSMSTGKYRGQCLEESGKEQRRVTEAALIWYATPF